MRNDTGSGFRVGFRFSYMDGGVVGMRVDQAESENKGEVRWKDKIT